MNSNFRELLAQMHLDTFDEKDHDPIYKSMYAFYKKYKNNFEVIISRFENGDKPVVTHVTARYSKYCGKDIFKYVLDNYTDDFEIKHVASAMQNNTRYLFISDK